MKTGLVLIPFLSIAVIFVSGCATPPPIATSHEQKLVKNPDPNLSAAPPVLLTGDYVCDQFLIALRLHSSGGYEVRCDMHGHTSERGVWAWSEQRQEFLLDRTDGDFKFALRRLRVDKRDPDRLQWIPPLSADYFSGGKNYDLVDYVSFKHQKY